MAKELSRNKKYDQTRHDAGFEPDLSQSRRERTDISDTHTRTRFTRGKIHFSGGMRGISCKQLYSGEPPERMLCSLLAAVSRKTGGNLETREIQIFVVKDVVPAVKAHRTTHK